MTHELTVSDPSALSIIRTLRDHGHQAYLVGGCVRDLLLGREPADYDVATSATPDEVMRIFPETYAVGAQFGVVLIPVSPVTPCPLWLNKALTTGNTEITGEKLKLLPSAPTSATPMAAIPTKSASARTPSKTCSAATSPSTACCSIPSATKCSITSAARKIYKRRIIRAIGDPGAALRRGQTAHAARRAFRRALRLCDRTSNLRCHPETRSPNSSGLPRARAR